ncbi:hypothetical protein C882_4098 [Caenispirillum salinarum AK4]|uniref:TIGR02444 family protein n=1 Tax=Caenispirillum salinarum AK4 TaxID=1238182 RepID=K9HQQ9_9PROT|nr:TIGR02444 family protein [Caenispirillum salinarum]EKV30761.1 hypothetical protein C882_4098 [Caenispirillum salinarum AK4]
MTDDVSPQPPAPPVLAPEEAAAHPFWRFSLSVYGRAGVAEAALALQNRRGADVNLLLFLLWRTASGHDVSDALLSRAAAVSRDWQAAVVGPVRRARKAVKGMGGLYSRLKETELACEQAEQMALAGLVDDTASEAAAPVETRRLAAETALRAYLSTLPGTPMAGEEEALEALVRAALAER